MTWLDDIDEPTPAELWAIEAEAELLAAELALVEAEARWFSNPRASTAAAYLQALIDVADLHDFTDHEPAPDTAPARVLEVIV